MSVQIEQALLRGRNTVGVTHLAMHAVEEGLISAWKQQVEAIAEPSVFLPFTF